MIIVAATHAASTYWSQARAQARYEGTLFDSLCRSRRRIWNSPVRESLRVGPRGYRRKRRAGALRSAAKYVVHDSESKLFPACWPRRVVRTGTACRARSRMAHVCFGSAGTWLTVAGLLNFLSLSSSTFLSASGSPAFLQRFIKSESRTRKMANMAMIVPEHTFEAHCRVSLTTLDLSATFALPLRVFWISPARPVSAHGWIKQFDLYRPAKTDSVDGGVVNFRYSWVTPLNAFRWHWPPLSRRRMA